MNAAACKGEELARIADLYDDEVDSAVAGRSLDRCRSSTDEVSSVQILETIWLICPVVSRSSCCRPDQDRRPVRGTIIWRMHQTGDVPERTIGAERAGGRNHRYRVEFAAADTFSLLTPFELLDNPGEK
jgi:hypothetical protein